MKTVKVLLQNGADMHIKDTHGTSALHFALSLRGYSEANKIIGLLREFNTMEEVDWEWKKPSSRREYRHRG